VVVRGRYEVGYAFEGGWTAGVTAMSMLTRLFTKSKVRERERETVEGERDNSHKLQTQEVEDDRF
jgi:hypothetical protein